MVRVRALMGLCATLTAAGLAGCRDDGITTPGILDQGFFTVSIGGHKDTTYKGEAAFYKTVQDGSETLTLFFVNEGARFQMTFSLREFNGEPEVYDLDLSPDEYEGTFSYTAGGQRATYSITGGTISFKRVSRFSIEGEIDFDGIATTGNNVGGTGSVKGTFMAVCEGDCLGGTGPPPGS